MAWAARRRRPGRRRRSRRPRRARSVMHLCTCTTNVPHLVANVPHLCTWIMYLVLWCFPNPVPMYLFQPMYLCPPMYLFSCTRVLHLCGLRTPVGYISTIPVLPTYVPPAEEPAQAREEGRADLQVRAVGAQGQAQAADYPQEGAGGGGALEEGPQGVKW